MAPIDPAHEDDLGDYYLAGTSQRPGTFFVNTRPPRPAHELAATSFHEANPGHHLQTTLELAAPDRHPLRRNASELQGAAHVEGWGLYSERLADEMGLYQDDHERLGMLNLQALRAARLVADTGIHAAWVAGGGDVRGFHDALLGLGLLPLADLRAELGGGGGFDR